MPTDDANWATWCDGYDQAETGIRRVFAHRFMFFTMNQMIGEAGPTIGLNNVVQNYLVSTYVGAVCAGIRLECDRDPQTKSLYQGLAKLTKNPAMADRARFEAGVDANPNTLPQYRARVKGEFDDFAVGPGSPDLDVSRITKDMDDLRTNADAVLKYTNKVLFHRDPVAVDAPTWVELDTALNHVGEVLKRYYRLRHPGMAMGNVTPDLPPGWEEPFRHAWCPPGFRPANGLEFDDYVHSTPAAP